MGSEWNPTHLRDIIHIKHGFAFKGEFFTDELSQYILLTPGNFAIGGGFQNNKAKYYRGPVPADFILEAGDLIVTMTDLSKAGDTLGYPALIPSSSEQRYLHNQRLGLVKVDDEMVDRVFLYYRLRNNDYRHHILATATGSTVRHTSPNRILDFSLYLPSLPEQRAIAAVLGALDDKIELNRRMNRTLEETARALFKSWFVDFDPVRAKMEGRPTGLPPEIDALFPEEMDGERPRGWEVGVVKDEFNLTMGQSPPGSTYNTEGEGIPFYQGKTDFGFRFPVRRMYCIAPTRFAEQGDTLVSVRAPVGTINMAIERCSVGRGVAAIRHKSGGRSYTYYAMENLKPIFDLFEGVGTVFGSINKNDFQGISILIPPICLAEEFERHVFPLDQMIENNEHQSISLAALRDALLPKLMSGEVRVLVAEQVVVDAL